MHRDYWDYLNWDVEHLGITKKLVNDGVIVTLPDLDDFGRRVIIINMNKLDIKVHSNSDLIRAMCHNSNFLQDDPVTSLTGLVYIYNGCGLTLQNMPSMRDLHFLAKSSDLGISRIKAVILYKFPFFMNATIKFAKSLQSKKIQNRMHITHSLEEIHNIMKSRSIFPISYGGDLTSERQSAYDKELYESEKAKKIIKVYRDFRVDFEKIPKRGWFGV